MAPGPIDGVRLIRLLRRQLAPFGLDRLLEEFRTATPPDLWSTESTARRNPLAWRLLEAESNIRQGAPSRAQPNESLVRLAMLAQNVESLSRAKVLGMGARLARLVADRPAFEAACYELEMAAFYVQQGFGVAFMPDGKSRTHDFDVHGPHRLHVECKRLAPVGMMVEKHESVWSRLLREAVRRDRDERIGRLVLDSPRLLREADSAVLSRCLHEALDAGRSGTFPAGEHMTLAVELASDGPLEPVKATEYTKVWSQQTLHLFPDGSVQEVGRREFIVRCPHLPDRTKAALDLVRTAADQLPAEGPGLVCLSIAGLTKRGLSGGLGPFQEQVAVLLSRRPQVSACLLTMEVTQSGRRWRKIETRSRTVANPAAGLAIDSAMVPP